MSQSQITTKTSKDRGSKFRNERQNNSDDDGESELDQDSTVADGQAERKLSDSSFPRVTRT